MENMNMTGDEAALNDFRFPVDKEKKEHAGEMHIALTLLSGIPIKELREANAQTRARTIKAAFQWAEEIMEYCEHGESGNHNE